MPLGPTRIPPFKSPKTTIANWNTFRKGLNTLFRETEIDNAEVVAATNLLLIGSGIPTKRWGSANYFLAGATGYGRALEVFKDKSDNITVLAMTDWGVLTKQSGASYTTITGFSWASGYNLEMVQQNNIVYMMNGQQPMAKWDFTTLVGFNTLAIPTGLAITNLSGATGATNWSWKVTTLGNTGETIGSTPISLNTLPAFGFSNSFMLTWSGISAATYSGYNIYRGSPGNEVFIGGVPAGTTKFFDNGSVSGSLTLTPTVDTTGGVTSKYMIRYQDRLVLAGIPNNPTAVYISAEAPQETKFDALSGGAIIYIEPNSGEDITGIATYFNSSLSTQTIIVFKERSVWEVRLGTFTFGNFTILNPTYRLLTTSQGCTSHRSIRAVENDIMFMNRRGIYMLRYEPQLLNIINASELSAKIRPFFQGLSTADLNAAAAIYVDKKYIVSFPALQQSMMFDRERLCFTGPWTTPFGINKWSSYVDSSGMEHWICIDSSDNYVTEFKSTYTDDKGTAFRTVFRSKKEDFGDWTLFKSIAETYYLFANITGAVSVNLYLEERNGSTVLAKSFTITTSTGQSGMGTDLMGLSELGLSTNTAKFASSEYPRKSYIYTTARTVQFEVVTTNSGDNYQLLGLKAIGIPQARGNNPSSWIV